VENYVSSEYAYQWPCILKGELCLRWPFC